MRGQVSQLTLLRELEPTIEMKLSEYIDTSTIWVSSDYVEPELFWSAPRSRLTETAKAALVTTLLTHNNHQSVSSPAVHSAWVSWTSAWSDEKSRHATAIEDYLVATRSVDPIALDRARFQCMTVGIASAMEGDHLLRSIAHATIDVMATMVSHRNAAIECADPVASALLGRIVSDQERQVEFLRSVAAAAFEIVPAQTAAVVTEVIMNFQMPGSGLPGFERSSMLIERHGIYDLRRHIDEVVRPALAYWRFFERSDLELGARSAEILSDFLADLETQATSFEARRLRAS
ncbi:acyl-ACP desaturase [Rhodococcoides kyotonense]|uniref:Acyl-[acyl-carrier-protein] desaturase n=1 Tax=Rhodococcoides kyotonense TaxID=398843 RepID=A0A239EG41_9NOCA|nr:acyl-ACP desaturase [Rhodococcus kyotonensis]SNS43519.1 acyl-[acyl-carrier-protein] desaturase [Rhodococcus kyotonensis]